VIKESLEKGTMSRKEHIINLERVAEKITEKGLQWVIPDSHAPNQLLHYLVDKDSNILAYIQQLTNSKASEPFYTANCIRNHENVITISTSNSVDLLKTNIDAYITGTVIKEVAQEGAKNLAKVTPEKSPSKEYALSF
jgi:hypothetical protein